MNNTHKDSPLKIRPEERAFCGALVWWTMLTLAVMAVPLFGASVAIAITNSPFAQMIAFVLSCWISVWLGMWLMKKANYFHNKK